MKTKEELIKDAWGEHYEHFKYNLDVHGYYITYNIRMSDFSDLKLNKNHFDLVLDTTHESFFGDYPIIKFRPKSLKDIEYNNGWNIITDDLEFTTETFWLYNSSNRDLFRGRLFDDDKLPIHRYATHYQPIEKPKPPLY